MYVMRVVFFIIKAIINVCCFTPTIYFCKSQFACSYPMGILELVVFKLLKMHVQNCFPKLLQNCVISHYM